MKGNAQVRPLKPNHMLPKYKAGKNSRAIPRVISITGPPLPAAWNQDSNTMLTALNTAASMSAIITSSPVSTRLASPTTASSSRRKISTGMVMIAEVATDRIVAVRSASFTRAPLRAPYA
ncbi:Uncharacterised protein [Mycobacterium tuberculosis]|nr:Uncharacterised protein [Mycobacterium tuberculosis]